MIFYVTKKSCLIVVSLWMSARWSVRFTCLAALMMLESIFSGWLIRFGLALRIGAVFIDLHPNNIDQNNAIDWCIDFNWHIDQYGIITICLNLFCLYCILRINTGRSILIPLHCKKTKDFSHYHWFILHFYSICCLNMFQ